MSPATWRGAIAAATVLAVSGFTYVRTMSGSLCLYWGTRQVQYLLNDFSGTHGAQDVCAATTDPAAAQTAVRASFDAWTAAGGQLTCTDLQLLNGTTAAPSGFTTSTHTGYDGENIVVFRAGPCDALAPGGASDPCFTSHTCSDTYNCWDTTEANHTDPRIIALTTVSYSTRTGQILDADMELNAAWPPLGTTLPTSAGYYFTCGTTGPICGTVGQSSCIYIDVQNTVTHEAGHFIGFAHNTDPNSTMYPTATPGDTSKQTLYTEDIQGVCDVYPTGKPPLTCGTSSGGGCGCGTTGAEGVLGLAAVLLAWRRRGARARRG